MFYRKSCFLSLFFINVKEIGLKLLTQSVCSVVSNSTYIDPCIYIFHQMYMAQSTRKGHFC